jgi:hypothetical protein
VTTVLMGKISSDALEQRMLASENGKGPPLTREEARRLTLEAMPPFARAAYEAGEQRAQEWRAQKAREEHGQRLLNSTRAPVLVASATTAAPAARKEETMLLTEDQIREREIIAQMATPLNEREKKICQMTGVTEAGYLEERNRLLAEKLPGGQYGLTEGELYACRALGMTPEQWRAAR